MRSSSIFASITLNFTITILSVIVAFWLFIVVDVDKYNEELDDKYFFLTKSFLAYKQAGFSDKDNIERLSEYGLKLISPHVNVERFLNKMEVVSQRVYLRTVITRLSDGDHMYLSLHIPNYLLIFKDETYMKYRYVDTIIILFIVLTLITISYIATTRKLSPIRNLINDMNAFAKGKLDIKTGLDGEDEISQIAQSFENAVNQIRNLINSRTLFLRNIMHELKTPITKGRLSVEMIDNEKQKQRLQNVFERLECLINEFALIEQISAGKDTLEKKPYRLVDLIDQAIDVGMIDQGQVIKEYDDKKLEVDYKLFSVAIKNMIDNAIKYSYDSKVCIRLEGNELSFINVGDALKHPLEYYIEPFVKGENRADSFGLGLYIVYAILKSHGYELSYRYFDDKNIFSFVLK